MGVIYCMLYLWQLYIVYCIYSSYLLYILCAVIYTVIAMKYTPIHSDEPRIIKKKMLVIKHNYLMSLRFKFLYTSNSL